MRRRIRFLAALAVLRWLKICLSQFFVGVYCAQQGQQNARHVSTIAATVQSSVP